MLRSLLLTRNSATVRMIDRSFRDLEVEVDHYSDSGIALSSALEHRYDAILLDDEIEDAAMVLEKILGLPSCGKSVRIVLSEPRGSMTSTLKSGVQIVLYKPLSAERVRQGLRAVRNLMARERRRQARVSLLTPARVSPRHARMATAQVLLADLSDTGAAIRYETGDLPAGSVLNLEFALPGDPERFHCLAELVWQDNQGSAGVRFLDMPSYARQHLMEWLRENAKSSRRSKATSAG